MTASLPPARRASLLTTLLAISLVVVTLLPLFIFAADVPHWRSVQEARARALARSGITVSQESEEAFRLRRQRRRATIHPTPGSVAEAVVTQLAALVLIGFAGKRLFALRL